MRKTFKLKHFISRRGFDDLEIQVNNYCSLSLSRQVVIKMMEDNTPAGQLLQQTGGQNNTLYIAFISELQEIPGEPVKDPWTVQVKVLGTKTDNLDELERTVNQFCEKHQVTSIEVSKMKGAPGSKYSHTWLATLNYTTSLT